jgi:hypothetical protein
MTIRTTAIRCTCLLLISLVLILPVSAIVENIEIPASRDLPDRDRPENIAALKNHNAYIGESQEARMIGVISYINSISGGTGAGKLQEIRSDYMAAAASIPLMNRSDRINELRDEMCIQSGRFAQETQGRMLIFNGTPDGMRETVNISLNAFDRSLDNGTEPLWLAGKNARIVIFDRESQERNYTLRNLKDEGYDVTGPEEISDRINAKRSGLESAAAMSDGEKILAINTELRSLNQQFRNSIAALRAIPKTG